MEHQQQPVALIFAGQGNPTLGMGADLWDRNQQTRSIWECASDISGSDLRRACLKGPLNRLVQTPVQQLVITAINLSFYTLLRDKGADVIASCGHSVGEYSALYAADAITLETLFALIHFRATTMHALSKRYPGTMLAIKGLDYLATRDLIRECGAELDISCDNSCRQQVVGGTAAALSAFARRAGCETARLGVSGAWHTRLMQQGVQPMRDLLATVTIKPPRHRVVMNVSGQPEYQPDAIRENLALHLTHTVKWRDSLTQLLTAEAAPLLIDISHKAWLSALLRDFPAFTPERSAHCRTILADR